MKANKVTINDLKIRILNFLKNNPNQEEIEKFYINRVLIHTKDSINEILENEVY